MEVRKRLILFKISTIEYLCLLKGWVDSKKYCHWKVKAVFDYISKGNVVKDLIDVGLLYTFNDQTKKQLIFKWSEQGEKGQVKPPLIHSIIGGEQGNAMVRWRIQKQGEANDTTWNDYSLINSWQDYMYSIQEKNGFCQISGKKSFITLTHPKVIDNVKLVSTPTNKDYLTFRGKFTDDGEQAVGIGFDVSQKAHNTLRWLISRQSFRNDTQVIIAWAVSGEKIPEPMKDSYSLLSLANIPIEEINTSDEQQIDHTIDLGQSFAVNLNKYMSGYQTNLKQTDNIVIMGLDSATSGRMAITYYQEFYPDEYIKQISKWHNNFSWFQRHKKDKQTIWPISSPSPRAITEVLYDEIIGDSIKKKLKQNAIQRILPCIIESHIFPIDLLNKIIAKVSNRSAYKWDEQWLWEKHLCIACAIFKGHSKQLKQNREYKIALDIERKTRDYLFGRLLAIAEQIEEMAIFLAKDRPRTTNASRLMQRFVDKPSETWLSISKGIIPYQQRIRGMLPPLESAYKKLLDDVSDTFDIDEFNSPNKLSGEYLLGFHSQRKWLREHKLVQGEWILKSEEEHINELEIQNGEE